MELARRRRIMRDVALSLRRGIPNALEMYQPGEIVSEEPWDEL